MMTKSIVDALEVVQIEEAKPHFRNSFLLPEIFKVSVKRKTVSALSESVKVGKTLEMSGFCALLEESMHIAVCIKAKQEDVYHNTCGKKVCYISK